MATRKDASVRTLKVRKNASLREIYAELREAFTAADLAKFFEIEEGIPVEQILAEMEEINRTIKPRAMRESKPKRRLAMATTARTTRRAKPTRRSSPNVITEKDGIRRLRVKKTDSLRSIYAKYRQAFTAADLQKYAEIEEGIPAEKIIADMEEIHRKVTKERTAKKRKKA